MDGTQWTPKRGAATSTSLFLVADFFAAPAPPKPAPAPAPPSVPAWQEAIMNKLPVLTEGAADHAGAVCWVQRLQALVKVYGEFTGMADVACQEITGPFDAHHCGERARGPGSRGHHRRTDRRPHDVGGAGHWRSLK